jgi:hypothetical protein
VAWRNLKCIQAAAQAEDVQLSAALLADVTVWSDSEQDQVPNFGNLAGPQACSREWISAER